MNFQTEEEKKARIEVLESKASLTDAEREELNTLREFDPEKLSSDNKYATKRDELFDGVAGDSMSFSNFNVLGYQDVDLNENKEE